MRGIHIFYAVLTVAIWGCNFLAVHISLQEIPPFLLCSLRFIFSAVPAIFFIKRPKVSFGLLLLYASFAFTLQFAFLFLGMYLEFPTGLASVVMQSQMPFSILFAVIFLREIPSKYQIVGSLIAFIGILDILLQGNASLPFAGLICVLLAGASWGVSNIITRYIKDSQGLGLVVWGCMFSWQVPLLISFIFEGSDKIVYSLTHISLSSVIAMSYTVFISTLVGYGLWNSLLSKYKVSTVVPFGLLAPFVGMFTACIALHESMESWEILAAGLVILGLGIDIFGETLVKKIKKIVHNTARR
jgi:O-acetylserine/cysteine efflux transporter